MGVSPPTVSTFTFNRWRCGRDPDGDPSGYLESALALPTPSEFPRDSGVVHPFRVGEHAPLPSRCVMQRAEFHPP